MRRAKVETRISALDPGLNDTLPLLYTLMGLHEGPDPVAQMDPQIKRRRTLDAIKRIILRESLNQPSVVIFEDLHWIDGETQALLDLLADGIANSGILVLVNYRPEYSHTWTNKSYYTQLRLDALGRESVEAMLSTLLGDGVELDPLKRLIIERTEGNPFFIEEMVQALFDEGALVRNGTVKVVRSLAQLRMPPTVQGILAARIDRLPSERKDLLQTLAVLGRESPLRLIRQVVSATDAQLEPVLADLQAGEFIYEQAAAGDIEYVFKHALTQEVAYNSLLIERRKQLHERIGDAIESLYAEHPDDHLSNLAHHYSRSTNARKAVNFLGLAGRQAMERIAYPEALVLLTKGLELLKEIPDGVERTLEEIDLQTALGWLLYATGNLAGPEREAAVVRAEELCEQVGDKERMVDALLALSNVRHQQAEYQSARALVAQALALGEGVDDPRLVAQARFRMGENFYWLGDFPASREHCEKALELFGSGPYRNFWEAENVRWSRFYAIVDTALLGYPDMARKRSGEALANARRSSDPVSVAMALQTEFGTYSMLRDMGKALERADEQLSIGTEYAMPVHTFLGASNRAWALAVQGQQTEESIAKLQTFEAATAGWKLSNNVLSFMRLDCYRSTERIEEGIELAAEILVSVQKDGLKWFDPQLYQIQGELLMRGSKAAEAQSCFRQAIEMARDQNAKIWELRATTSLARLLDKQGRRDEARAMLADIYGWFTEGFDTADLKDAKELLDELAR